MHRHCHAPAVALAAMLAGGGALAEPLVEVVATDEVAYQPLNPARGDASPRAGVLWGDITQDVPSGVLLRFADGFASPPHIHNITYRAVVISGAVHNDDPDAADMWMGPGSYWMQPAGEPHVTAAVAGSGATAFLEILEGPYLVQPTDEAFDNGEHPLNLDAGNMVWLPASDVTWLGEAGAPATGDAPATAFLWGSLEEGGENGSLLRLPAGYSGELTGTDAWLRAVVIEGVAGHGSPGEEAMQTLEPGSYFGAKGSATQIVSCESEAACVLYLRTEGGYALAAR